MAASSSSPHKPRLLWRGALHLRDGTALPGVAIVSHVQPCFSSQSSKEDSGEASLLPSPLPMSPPFTLAREQQDALSLSIEMVRHAPINVVEVVEKVDQDETGTISKPRRVLSSNPKENGDQVCVSYEAAGGIRMYVDPACPSTSAYMERLFCYDDEDDNEDDGEKDEHGSDVHQNKTGGTSRCTTPNVVVLSLDKSHRYVLNPTPDADDGDVFSGETSDTWHHLKTSASGAIEAVLIGVRRREGHDEQIVDLHVGQKVIRKTLRQESTGTATTAVASASLDQRPPFLLGLRPDDPAPRSLSRVLTAKYRSTPHVSSRLPSSAIFVPPALPSPREGSTSGDSKRIVGPSDNTTRSTSMPMLKRESSSPNPLVPPPPPRGDKRTKQSPTAVESGESDCRIEEKNRSLIKKLVHHQLLGKGLEKKDERYLSCFNPTCNGTVLALKKQFKTEIIDRVQAASIIEKHLEMYL